MPQLTSECAARVTQADPTAAHLRATAQALAADGYAVFPLVEGTKRPVEKGGYRTATRDPEKIAAWWSDRPYNVGISAGGSGMVVVDLDVKRSDGLQSWAQATRGLDLPEPVIVHTPSGGEHWYYRAEGDALQLKNTAENLPGVDVRTEGGHVVAPGSYTVAAGDVAEGYYTPADGDPLPPVEDLPAASSDLVRVLTAGKSRERSEVTESTSEGLPLYPEGQRHALWYEYDKLAGIEEGGRNHQLNESVFALAQIASAENSVIAESDVRTMAERACHANGLIEDDGWAAFCKTYDSAWSAGSDKPRALGNEAEKLSHEVAEALHRMRVTDEAKRIFQEEQAARDFELPGGLRSLVDDLAAPREEDTWLVEGLLPTGGNLVIAAAYKTGKTTLVQNLTRSLVDGEPFLDRYTVSPLMGRVALFNFELTRTQQLAWLEESGIRAQAQVMLAHLRGMRGVLTTEAGKRWAVEQLKSNSVQVWIVDPFARAASGIDENSNTEVGLFLEALDDIKRRAGVSELVLITHTGRGNADEPARARGATRLNDWADTNMVVTKTASGQRSFVAEGRDVWINKTLLSYDIATRRLTAAEAEEAGASEERDRQAILAFVAQHGEQGASLRDIRSNVPGVRKGKDHIDPIIQRLTNEGLLSRTGPKKGGHPTYLVVRDGGQTEMGF